MGRNRVTLQTIADRLGVSRTTVSNAYNRPDQLAPELRERVLATAEELGYTGPDAAARRLRTGGPEAVGLGTTARAPAWPPSTCSPWAIAGSAPCASARRTTTTRGR